MTRQSATDASPTSHDEAPTFRSLSDCILCKKDCVFLGGRSCSGIRLALVSSYGGMVPCIHQGDTVCDSAGSFAPLLLYSRCNATGSHWVGSWVGPTAGEDAVVEDNDCAVVEPR
jgi:hypothetical protein